MIEDILRELLNRLGQNRPEGPRGPRGPAVVLLQGAVPDLVGGAGVRVAPIAGLPVGVSFPLPVELLSLSITNTVARAGQTRSQLAVDGVLSGPQLVLETGERVASTILGDPLRIPARAEITLNVLATGNAAAFGVLVSALVRLAEN